MKRRERPEGCLISIARCSDRSACCSARPWPCSYRIALIKLLGGGLLFGAWFALLIWTAWRLIGPGVALAVGLSLVPLGVFAHRYVIDLRLYRFGLRKNLRRLVYRRRFLRLEIRHRWLTRELASLRSAYLAEHPVAEPVTTSGLERGG